MLTGKNDSNEKSTSILAKVGNAVSGVGGFLGRGAKALGWGIIYPIWPKNWFKSWNEIEHDIKNGWHSVIEKPHKEYDPPIKTTQASEYLGVQITKQGKGEVAFLASRTLAGDVFHLTDEQLNQIKELNKNSKYSKIAVNREKGKIIIEVDVKSITNNVEADSKNEGKSPEKIKELVIEAIKQKVDDDLKKLAKITGGELERHMDQGLLYGIAEKLYPEDDNQNKSSEVGESQGSSGEELSSWQGKVESQKGSKKEELISRGM
ncbi:hypothetical protein [Wolbachia endosymbiont of Cantharis cryptica]|uniref:hypothetical protein n=1 Tax=Wolbachia endosymbiont of Cantharis cryptica TaxID=3066132 RepID=UPI00376EF373